MITFNNHFDQFTLIRQDIDFHKSDHVAVNFRQFDNYLGPYSGFTGN